MQPWRTILFAARDRANQLGISLSVWQRQCDMLGDHRAALCLMIADRNAARADAYRVGLTGDERMFSPSDFKEAFRIARSEGLCATAHAGEHLGPDNIIEAIEVLGLERVGHGIRAIESEGVLRQLASAKVPLEVCLSSNLALNLCFSIGAHPAGPLAEAGCVIVLGTDDPSFFSTDIETEYRLAARLGLSAADITAQANAASFRST